MFTWDQLNVCFNREQHSLAAWPMVGAFLSALCCLCSVYYSYCCLPRTRPTSRELVMLRVAPPLTSWNLSGVLEPLSIDVATFAHQLEATDGFGADRLIGTGGSGDVYKARLKDRSHWFQDWTSLPCSIRKLLICWLFFDRLLHELLDRH